MDFSYSYLLLQQTTPSSSNFSAPTGLSVSTPLLLCLLVTLIEKKMHGLALTKQDIGNFFWKLFECGFVAFSSMAIPLFSECRVRVTLPYYFSTRYLENFSVSFRKICMTIHLCAANYYKSWVWPYILVKDFYIQIISSRIWRCLALSKQDHASFFYNKGSWKTFHKFLRMHWTNDTVLRKVNSFVYCLWHAPLHGRASNMRKVYFFHGKMNVEKKMLYIRGYTNAFAGWFHILMYSESDYLTWTIMKWNIYQKNKNSQGRLTNPIWHVV